MRSLEILRDVFSKDFGFLHARRQAAIWRAVEGLMLGGRLWLTALGRDMRGPAKEKHRIKAVDRLLGNRAIQRALTRIYQAQAAWLLRGMTRPVVLVDWTGCGPDRYLLRAALPIGGRAILLHGRVVSKKDLASRTVHAEFLTELAAIVPEHCRPIIVTDAGFYFHWFTCVSRLRWDFVGRMRGRFHARFESYELPVKELLERAGRRPKDLGPAVVGIQRGGKCRLVLAPKPKPKGRKQVTQKGTPRRNTVALQRSEAAKEPWLLATSLSCAAKKVVAIYGTRMQLEESFRDLKSHRFGWSFEDVGSKQPRRVEVLLMIASLATLATLAVGATAERRRLDRQFQANTVRNRRTLSLFTLGRRVIRTAMDLSVTDLRLGFVDVRRGLRAVNPLAIVPL